MMGADKLVPPAPAHGDELPGRTKFELYTAKAEKTEASAATSTAERALQLRSVCHAGFLTIRLHPELVAPHGFGQSEALSFQTDSLQTPPECARYVPPTHTTDAYTHGICGPPPFLAPPP